MKYKFYGTAAAEAIPALWCECDVCKKARERGGRNIMSRSQQTINDELLIDFSQDTYMHVLQGLKLSKIHTLIVTHSHADHLYPYDIAARKDGCAYFEEKEQPLDIYATKSCIPYIEKAFRDERIDDSSKRFCVHTIEDFVPFTTKEGYRVTPLKANHGTAADAVFFLIERDGKCVLHGNDTGYFPEETWAYLEKHPVHIDFAEFDCTSINRTEEGCERGNHMNLPTAVHVREKLRELGMIDESTTCVINHFSHNGRLIYDEICEVASKEGFLNSYDGMEIEF